MVIEEILKNGFTHQVLPQTCPSPICFLECSPILYKETLQWLNFREVGRREKVGKRGGWLEREETVLSEVKRQQRQLKDESV